MKGSNKDRIILIIELIILAVFFISVLFWISDFRKDGPEEAEAKTVTDISSETKLTVEEADVLDARNGEGRWEEELPEVTPDHISEEKIDDEISENFNLFCDVVFAEAGNQGDKGLRLVADVIINRMRCGEAFDDTMHEVLTASGQFSCVRDGGAAKWKGHTKKKVRMICQEELAHTMNRQVYYFRTGHYGYGKQLFRYKDHYFSGR